METDTGLDGTAVLAMDARARDELASALFQRRIDTFGKTIKFSAPAFPAAPYEIENFSPRTPPVFTTISLTGTKCTLQCDHCRGSLLGSMIDGSGGALVPAMERAILAGTRGFLVSGGADPEGKVPIADRAGELAALKARHGIRIVVHTGFMDEADIEALAAIPVDGVMFDIVGTRETLRSVCHVDKEPDDLVAMIRACKDRDIPVMPHVVVGLDWGRPGGEVRAIELVARERPDALVMVVLMPVQGTPMERVVMEPAGIDPLLLLARLALPDIPVQLGCAKPPGKFKEWVERRAVDCGFNGVAYPLQETVDHARACGLEPVFTETCCTVSDRDW